MRKAYLLLPIVVLACAIGWAQTDLDQVRAKAEAGDIPAQLTLAKAYFLGMGVPKNEEEAVRWFRKAADKGEPQSQRILGLLSETGGAGVAKDEAQAVEWYRKAAAQGDIVSQSKLGEFYESGRPFLPKDEAQAAQWYHKAAKGNATNAAEVDAQSKAQTNLGKMFEEGRGVRRDEVEALSWYKKAAAQEDPVALNNAALICLNSRDPDVRDPAAGLNYARRAVNVKKNNPVYLNTLALAYFVEGQFADAVRTQNSALALAPPNRKAEYQASLNQYQRALDDSKRQGKSTQWKVPK